MPNWLTFGWSQGCSNRSYSRVPSVYLAESLRDAIISGGRSSHVSTQCPAGFLWLEWCPVFQGVDHITSWSWWASTLPSSGDAWAEMRDCMRKLRNSAGAAPAGGNLTGVDLSGWSDTWFDLRFKNLYMNIYEYDIIWLSGSWDHNSWWLPRSQTIVHICTSTMGPKCTRGGRRETLKQTNWLQKRLWVWTLGLQKCLPLQPQQNTSSLSTSPISAADPPGVCQQSTVVW